MTDVERAEFSKPELVWVGKVDEATTAGGIKDSRGLEVEYSAELTEEQIAEINAQKVEQLQPGQPKSEIMMVHIMALSVPM